MKDFLEVIREFEGFQEDVEEMAQFMIEKGAGNHGGAYLVARAIEAECTGDSHEKFIKSFFFGQVALHIKEHMLH